jgi:hypothetical protein
MGPSGKFANPRTTPSCPGHGELVPSSTSAFSASSSAAPLTSPNMTCGPTNGVAMRFVPNKLDSDRGRAGDVGATANGTVISETEVRLASCVEEREDEPDTGVQTADVLRHQGEV